VKEGDGNDNLAIAWQYPGQDRHVIPAEFSRVMNPVPVVTPVPEPPTVASEPPGGSNSTVLVAAISAGVIISFMALVIYYLRKVASNVKGSPGTNSERVVQMPEGWIQTAVATKIVDLETAEGSLLRASTAPPPYASHTSAPPLE
jgi:hypothetical protein